jgi:hypothetical protein
MSQHDLTIDNQGFPAFRADLNNALQALGSTQSGTSAPSPTFANQLWYDTTNNQLKIRNEDNDAWITLLTLDQTADSVSQLSAVLVALGAGSASSPSLTASGDTNTGLFFPTADTVGIACGGSEAARIILGQLSISATSSAASSLRLYEDTDNGTNYIDLIAPTSISSNRTLTIPDNSGTVLTSASPSSDLPSSINGPAFSAYSNAFVSVANNTFTKITFNTEDYDTNNNFASSRFTPTVAGYYQFNVTLAFAASAGVNTGGIFFYKNGTRHLDGSLLVMNTSYTQFISSSGIIYCNGSTDYVEVYASQATGSAQNIGSTASTLKFTGALVRSA